MSTDEVTINWLNRRLKIYVTLISLCAGFFVGGLTAYVVQYRSNTLFRNNEINTCDGNNLVRGVARLLTHNGNPTFPDKHNYVDNTLRVRDCVATHNTGHTVTLSPPNERAFLIQISNNRRVAVRVRDGKVRFVNIP